MIRRLIIGLFLTFPYQLSYGNSKKLQGTASSGHKLHQVEQLAQHQFRFNGGDPYIVYELTEPHSAPSPAVLFEGLDSPKPLSGRIFWSQNEGEFKESASISFENISLDKIYLNLGDQLVGSKWLRFDLDNCPCDLMLKNPVMLTPNKNFNAYTPCYRQLNFNAKTGYANFQGYDPQVFILPTKEIELDVASGIYLDFEYESTNKHDIFEIFWLFKNSNTNQKRTSYFSLTNQKQSRYKIFIPFKKLQSSKILKGIRLDPAA